MAILFSFLWRDIITNICDVQGTHKPSDFTDPDAILAYTLTEIHVKCGLWLSNEYKITAFYLGRPPQIVSVSISICIAEKNPYWLKSVSPLNFVNILVSDRYSSAVVNAAVRSHADFEEIDNGIVQRRCHARPDALGAIDCRPEDIAVLPIVIAEIETRRRKDASISG